MRVRVMKIPHAVFVFNASARFAGRFYAQKLFLNFNNIVIIFKNAFRKLCAAYCMILHLIVDCCQTRDS